MGQITINIYGCGDGAKAPDAAPASRALRRVEQGVPTFRRVRVANRARQAGANQVPKKLTQIAYRPRRFNGLDAGGNPTYLDGLLVGSPAGAASPPHPDLVTLNDKQALLSDHGTYQSMALADTKPTRVHVWLSIQNSNGSGPIANKQLDVVMPDEQLVLPDGTGLWIASLSLDFASYNNGGTLYDEIEYDLIYGSLDDSYGHMGTLPLP